MVILCCCTWRTTRESHPDEEPERWQHDFPGLALESVHWLADRGCKIFGVEAVSPAPEGELNFQAHNACGERGITHMEGFWIIWRVWLAKGGLGLWRSL